MTDYRAYWKGRHVVYRVYDATGRLIYVGRSRNLPARAAEHRGQSWWWKPLMVKVRVQLMPDEVAAKAAERAAIQVERPVFNAMGYADWADRPYWTPADWAVYRRVRPMALDVVA